MSHPILQAIEQRATTANFDAIKDVPAAQVADLVYFATRAASAYNLQNWRFIAVRSREAKLRLRQLVHKHATVMEAPITFIVCGQLADPHVLPGRLAPAVELGMMSQEMVTDWVAEAHRLYDADPEYRRDEAIRSASMGATTLMQAAQAMGLGSAPVIDFDTHAVKKAFGLAMDELPAMLLAVGYPALDNIPRKPRRPMSEVFEIR